MLNKKFYIQLSLSFFFSLSFISYGSAMDGGDTPYNPEKDLHSGDYSAISAGMGGQKWSANVIIRRDFLYKNLREFSRKHPDLLTQVSLNNKVPSLDADTEKKKQEILGSYLCTPEELKVRFIYLKGRTHWSEIGSKKAENPDILSLSIDTKTEADFSPHGTATDRGTPLFPHCPKYDITKPLWKEKVDAPVNKNAWNCYDCEISYQTVGWGPLRALELDVLMKAIETLDFVTEINFRGSHYLCEVNWGTHCSKHPTKQPFTRGNWRNTNPFCKHFNIDKFPISQTVLKYYGLSKGLKSYDKNEELYLSTLGNTIPKYLEPSGPSIEKKVLIDNFRRAIEMWKEATKKHLNNGKPSSQVTSNQSTDEVQKMAEEQGNTPPPTTTGAALPMINTEDNPKSENQETLAKAPAEKENIAPPPTTGAALPMTKTEDNPNSEGTMTLTIPTPASKTVGIADQPLSLPKAASTTKRQRVKKNTLGRIKKDDDDD